MQIISRAAYERLSPTARALLQVLLTHGGACATGHASIAAACGAAPRSIERAARDLDREGWVTRTARGRRPGTLALTAEAAQALARTVLADGGKKIAAPQGFTGDPDALRTAEARLKMRRPPTSVDFAQLYLEHADADEQARIASLLDDFGELPIHIDPTGIPKLDEGLHLHLAQVARKNAGREQQLRDLARGKY